MNFSYIPINAIDPECDEFFLKNEDTRNLQDSIRSIGLLNPLKLYQINNQYIIISGYRRYQCLKNLNNTVIPGIVYQSDEVPKKDAFKISLIDNYFRSFSEVEKAFLLKKLDKIVDKDDAFYRYALEHIIQIPKKELNIYLSIADLPDSLLELLKQDKVKIYQIKWLIGLNSHEKVLFSRLFTNIPLTKSQFYKFVELTMLACNIWDLPDLCSLFNIEELNDFIMKPYSNPKKAADALLQTLHKIAYPGLSMLQNTINQLAAQFNTQEIAIVPPDYLEADALKIIIHTNSMQDLLNKINYINDKKNVEQLIKIFQFAKKTFII